MKNSIFLILISLLTTFSSFANSTEKFIPLKECCEKVTVQSTYAGMNQFGCCLYDINVSNSSECNIYLFDNNGNSLPAILPNSNFSFQYSICTGLTSTIFVGPSKDPLEACWREDYTCDEEAECCDEVTVESTLISEPTPGCCAYEVNVSNKSDCELYVYDQNGQIYTMVSADEDKTVAFSICSGKFLTIFVGETMNPTDACWTEEFTCDSACCENVSVVSEFKFSTPSGCCIYEVTVTNDGDCPIIVYDQNGQIYTTVQANSSNNVFLQSCPGNPITLFAGETLDQTHACWNEEFTCGEDCCEGVSIESEFKFTNPTGCCIYEVTVTNDGDCPIIVYDQNGQTYTTVQANSSNNVFLQSCPGDPITLFAGETLDQTHACWNQEFTCGEDCCEGVSVESEFKFVTPTGCCIYEVIVTNDGDCPIIVYDQNGQIYTTVQANSSNNVFLQSCPGNPITLFAGETLDQTHACWREEFTCETDCCKDVEVESNFLGVDIFGCCVYDINIVNSSSCEIYLTNNFGNIVTIVPPKSNSNVDYRVCFGQVTLYVGTTSDPVDACWSETFDCSSKTQDGKAIESRLETKEHIDLNSIIASPNPFIDQFQFNCISMKAEVYTLSLFDSHGKLIKTTTGNLVVGKNAISLENLGDLPSNMYFYKFESGETTVFNKMIKQ